MIANKFRNKKFFNKLINAYIIYEKDKHNKNRNVRAAPMRLPEIF